MRKLLRFSVAVALGALAFSSRSAEASYTYVCVMNCSSCTSACGPRKPAGACVDIYPSCEQTFGTACRCGTP